MFFTNNKVVLKKAVSKQKLVPNKEDQKQNGSTGSNRHPGCGVQQRCIFFVFTRMVFQILCLRIKFCKTKSIFFHIKIKFGIFFLPERTAPRCKTSSIFWTIILCTSCNSVLSVFKLRRLRLS